MLPSKLGDKKFSVAKLAASSASNLNCSNSFFVILAKTLLAKLHILSNKLDKTPSGKLKR